MNKSLSAQIVPLLVLVVALLGVSSYVFGLDADTDVKTSIDALLPNQAVSADGSISVRYPDDWQQAEGALSFAPEDDETTNIAVSAQAGTIDDYLQNNSEATAYCAGDVCGYTRPGIFEGAGERQFYVVPGGENQILQFDYVTAPGDADKYQEVLNGMIRTAEITVPRTVFSELTYPEGWAGTVNYDPLRIVELSKGEDSITLFETELAVVPTLFQIQPQPGELTIQNFVTNLETVIPPEQLIQGTTPVSFADYSGYSISFADAEQPTIELIVLDIPESEMVLTVFMSASNSTFAETHTTAEEFVSNLTLGSLVVETIADTTNEVEDDTIDPEEIDRIPDEPEGISTTDGEDTDSTPEEPEGIAESTDGEATDRIPDEPEGISTEAPVLELTETFTDGVVTSLNHPAGWQVSVEPLGETGFSSVSLLSSTSNLSLFPVTTEFALTDLFGMPLPVDDIQPEDGFAIFLTGLGAQFIEEQTPLTIGEYTGSKAVVSNNGAPVEFGFVTLDAENLVVYSLDGAPENFETARATAYEIIRTMELDMSLVGVPATDSEATDDTSDASDTEVDATDSETTDDTSDASDAEADTADGETTDDTSDASDAEVDTTDGETADDTSDASDAEADTADGEVTDDTSVASDAETDATDGENTADSEDTSDTNDAESDTNVEVTVSETRPGVEALPLGDTFTNSDIGLTVEVPEGFNARGDSNYLYVDQVASSMRFAIGTPEEIAERLELEIETVPNEDVAVNLMTQFASNSEDSERYDSVSGVTVNDNGNRAYVDATRSSAKRRFLVLELEDGRLLYVELKARVADFDVMSATTMAMLENMVVEAPVDE